MHRTPHSALPHLALAATALIAAVVFRSWFFLQYEESYFDSDQAIVGLMAKHLVEGRALPLFFYGQEYMLAVEAWMMAPVFGLLGPTVFALRLTMIFINVTTALTLWWLLVRDAKLSRSVAALASGPFVLAPFITSAHLVEAQGGNVEPFLWVLIAWLLRGRPIALGAAMGIAFLHREFTAYALPALLLVQIARAQGGIRTLVRPWLITAAAFLVVFVALNALKPYADLLGPDSAGVPIESERGTVSLLLARADVRLDALPERFRQLGSEYLPLLLGLAGYRPAVFGIGSGAHVGWGELLPVVSIASVVLLVWMMVDLARRRQFDGVAFPAYLLVVGVEAGVTLALTRNWSIFTFRYGLLALFVPIAIGAVALQASRPALLRALAAMLLAMLISAAALDHVSVLREAVVAPPPPRLAPLAAHLEARGVTVARAGYWRAYVLSFLTRERLKVASTEVPRIREYQLLADQRADETVTIREKDCEGRREIEVFEGWHLCR
jgi:hypothetical protein